MIKTDFQRREFADGDGFHSYLYFTSILRFHKEVEAGTLDRKKIADSVAAAVEYERR